MRQPKEPTKQQKVIIGNHKLVPGNWLVLEETETHLFVVYRHGDYIKPLDKSVNLWKEK